MFILKVKGSSRWPDYVQIRDDDMTLLAFFRMGSHEKALLELNLGQEQEQILIQINNLPFGIIQRINITPHD